MGDGGAGGRGHRVVPVYALSLGLLAAWLLLGAGCASKPAHVRSAGPPPAFYTVRKGDTLYGISFRYNLDYRTVARWNGIRPPYRIYPGQRIRLTAPKVQPRKPAPHRAKRESPSVKTARARTAERPIPKRRSTPPVSSGIAWQWPTEGRLVRRFVADRPGRKGIDIAGRIGQPVRAAAAGKVVYAGSGLRGYGELIIIKHNEIYLSAYAHNRRILVKEGDRVRKGQKIAELGSSGTDSPKLHFEIRRDGKPVDPLKYLPRR